VLADAIKSEELTEPSFYEQFMKGKAVDPVDK